MRGGIVVKQINLNQFESEKLMEHIEDAKDWLDKAKDYYKQANPTHAEMTLNLAQAEVKYAWELSRQRHVSNKQITIPKRKFNHLIAAAASVLVMLGLIFWYHQGETNRYLASNIELSGEGVSVDSGSKSSMAKNDQKVLEAAVPKEVRDESEKLLEPVSRPAGTGATSEPQGASLIPGETERERSGSENVQSTVRIRQASQFTIDEDALTREASRSLRNGK